MTSSSDNAPAAESSNEKINIAAISFNEQINDILDAWAKENPKSKGGLMYLPSPDYPRSGKKFYQNDTTKGMFYMRAKRLFKDMIDAQVYTVKPSYVLALIQPFSNYNEHFLNDNFFPCVYVDTNRILYIGRGLGDDYETINEKYGIWPDQTGFNNFTDKDKPLYFSLSYESAFTLQSCVTTDATPTLDAGKRKEIKSQLIKVIAAYAVSVKPPESAKSRGDAEKYDEWSKNLREFCSALKREIDNEGKKLDKTLKPDVPNPDGESPLENESADIIENSAQEPVTVLCDSVKEEPKELYRR